MSDCDYCYGTMGLCPVCGPFEYAPSESVGYDPSRGQDQAEHVNGWDLSGRLSDWHDTANATGWSRRDTLALFEKLFPVSERDRLHEASIAASSMLSLVRRP